MDKKVTIREVAKLAGVSISSVSRYINSPTSVKPVAAYRIKAAIQELDYEPSAAAQNLKRGQSRMIGVIVPHMRAFFEEASAVITDFFCERGYMTSICLSNGEEQKERFFIEELLRQQAAGIVIAPSGKSNDFLHKVYRKYGRLVLIDRAEDIGCPIILENHRENAHRLVSYVLRNGSYNRLMFLHGWENTFSARMCLEGGMAAVGESGFPDEYVMVRYTHSKLKGTLEALDGFMHSLSDYDHPAIIAYGTDILEYTVMGLHQHYPQWINRCGLAGFALPGTREKLGIACSLVIKNPQEVGAQAAEILYRQIQGLATEAGQVFEIPVSFSF